MAYYFAGKERKRLYNKLATQNNRYFDLAIIFVACQEAAHDLTRKSLEIKLSL